MHCRDFLCSNTKQSGTHLCCDFLVQHHSSVSIGSLVPGDLAILSSQIKSLLLSQQVEGICCAGFSHFQSRDAGHPCCLTDDQDELHRLSALLWEPLWATLLSLRQTCLIPTQQWYVVRCGSMNKHQQDICLKETGLRAQDMRVILGHSRHDSEDLCDHLMKMNFFTLIMKKIFI